jgi:hypothetical protein
MKNRIMASAATLALTTAALVAAPGTVQAATAAPPVVSISVQGNQAVVSPAMVRPGVVEFQVGDTFAIPDSGPDALSVLQTDQLDLVLSTLPSVFGDFTDPAAAAASAAGMRTIHAIATFYGGATKGMTWRVYLKPGTYTVMGVQSTAMGMAKPATFTVAGTPRAGVLPYTEAAVRAIGPVGANKWTFRQSKAPVQWMRFTNSAKELHFLGMEGVKSDVTPAMVKSALMSPDPPKFLNGKGLHFDVVSPGVSVAIKGPIPAGRYLVDCFIPSETDGMPHALMGMWKLIDVR